MSNSIKKQINFLINLQEIELQTYDIEATLSDVSTQFDALDNKLVKFEQIIKDEQFSLDELKKNYRSDDSEMQTFSSQIKKNNEKLGAIKTNKEYNALLKEIEDLEKKNSQIEDKMLEDLECVEKTEKLLVQKQKEYSQLDKNVVNEKELIKQKIKKLEKKLVQLNSDKDNVSDKIDQKLLDTYNTIKQRTGKIAVSRVENSICKGCNVNIPPQLYNELHRQDSLKFCPKCQRIIYATQ